MRAKLNRMKALKIAPGFLYRFCAAPLAAVVFTLKQPSNRRQTIRNLLLFLVRPADAARFIKAGPAVPQRLFIRLKPYSPTPRLRRAPT